MAYAMHVMIVIGFPRLFEQFTYRTGPGKTVHVFWFPIHFESRTFFFFCFFRIYFYYNYKRKSCICFTLPVTNANWEDGKKMSATCRAICICKEWIRDDFEWNETER